MAAYEAAKPSRIKLIWSGNRRRDVALAYDLKEERLLLEITDYSLYLAAECDEKTVRNEIMLLKGFIEFLVDRRLGYQDVKDSVLVTFRNEEYARVQSARNSSDSEKAAKRTVNAKLRRTYKFLYWLQKKQKLVERLIGPHGCPVSSTYREKNETRDRKPYGRYGRGSSSGDFPKLFGRAGERGRSSQYEATDEDVQKIADMFHHQASSHAAQRNILMMDLACQLSWRRGAINSLTCDQFSNLDFLETDYDSYVVVPPSQKFGYEREFEVPFRLAFRVAEFIATERRNFLSQKGWSEVKTQGRIFISERNGKPLENGTLSAIFGKAFKVLSRPRGANIHSFRRKFANDQIDEEILNRLELGLDTSERSVAAAVAFRMGQSHPDSLQPYVNRRISRMVKRHAKLRESRVRTLENENKELKDRIALLEKTSSDRRSK